MKHMLQICCKNNNIYKEFPIGSSLLDIYYGFNLNFPYQVVSAKVNNRSEGLNFRVYNNKDVEFLDVRDSSGMRTYVRSLCFILYKAVSELFPEGKLFVEHPVSKGYFCNLRIGRPIELEDVSAIKKRMQEIIAEDIPFRRTECHTTEAVRVFSERGMNDKVKLLETSGSPEAALAGILDCRFGGPHNYFGEEVWKPYIGDNERPLTTEDMRIAVRINRSVEWIMVIIVVATATCMYVIPSFF